jgi:hypothetical protein
MKIETIKLHKKEKKKRGSKKDRFFLITKNENEK